jgi:hypothetical protein
MRSAKTAKDEMKRKFAEISNETEASVEHIGAVRILMGNKDDIKEHLSKKLCPETMFVESIYT